MALNDEYDDDLKCVDCGSYYCSSKWFPGSCDAKQRDLFDENVEQEYKGNV